MRPSKLLASLTALVYTSATITAAASTPSLPGNVEIDLVFPRNETYAPATKFPIVFVIQGTSIAYNFGFHFSWYLRPYGVTNQLVDSASVGDAALLGPVVAPADPLVVANGSIALGPNSGNATYTLEWQFGFYANCTDDDKLHHIESVPANARGSLSFTVQKGAPQAPDILVAAAASGGCALVGSVVPVQANLTGCPHISDSGIAANPCAIKVDAAFASSISSSIGATAASTTTTAASTGGASSSPTPTGSGTTGVGGVSSTKSAAAASTTSSNAAWRNDINGGSMPIMAGLAGMVAAIV